MTEADIEPLDPYTFGEHQRCFGCGPHNVRGMRLKFRREGDAVITDFTPELGLEGPPHVFHGGLQSMVADEVAGWALVGLLGRMGFTTSLRMRYVRPLKIGEVVTARAKLKSRKGAFATLTVRLEQGGKLGSAATVSYMLPDEEKASAYLSGGLPDEWRHLFRE